MEVLHSILCGHYDNMDRLQMDGFGAKVAQYYGHVVDDVELL